MEDPELDWIGEDGVVATARLAERLEALRDRLRRMVALRLDPRLRGRVDASDVIQEAFVEATIRAPRYASERKLPFLVWVRFLTVQKLAQFHRRHLGARQRDVRREAPIRDMLGPQASSIVAAEVLAAGGASPSQHMIVEERRSLVAAVLDSLSEDEREILVLRHFEGLSNRECAGVLGLTDSGASRRYLRAARRFGESARARGIEDSAVRPPAEDVHAG